MSALNVMIFLRRLRGRLSAAVTNICPGMVKRGEGYFLDNRNQKYQYLSTRGETALAAIGKKRSIAPDGYCGEGAAERARGLSSRASRKPRERAARDQTSRKPRPALGDTAFFGRAGRLASRPLRSRFEGWPNCEVWRSGSRMTRKMILSQARTRRRL